MSSKAPSKDMDNATGQVVVFGGEELVNSVRRVFREPPPHGWNGGVKLEVTPEL